MHLIIRIVNSGESGYAGHYAAVRLHVVRIGLKGLLGGCHQLTPGPPLAPSAEALPETAGLPLLPCPAVAQVVSAVNIHGKCVSFKGEYMA